LRCVDPQHLELGGRAASEVSEPKATNMTSDGACAVRRLCSGHTIALMNKANATA
jgi:hypothetical protein